MHAVVTAADFKARCLDLLDQVADGRVTSLTVTKRGRAVAVVGPVPVQDAFDRFYGSLAGSVVLPGGIDLTEPILDVPWDPEIQQSDP